MKNNERISEKDHMASLLTEGMIACAGAIGIASNAPILEGDDDLDPDGDYDEGRDLSPSEPATAESILSDIQDAFDKVPQDMSEGEQNDMLEEVFQGFDEILKNLPFPQSLTYRLEKYS